MKGVIILCEGRHDVAFLSVLLKHEGYTDYKKTIGKMVQPLKEYFITKFERYDYESSQLFNRPVLPWIMEKKEGQSNMYILLYSMDGLDKIDNYREIINDFYFQANNTEAFAEDNGFQDSTFSIGFIVDADDKGIKSRVDFIKNKFIDILPDMNGLNHGKEGIKTTNKKRFKAIGCFVLTKQNSDLGNLEDVLLPIMENGNEKLFNEAQLFLTSNHFSRTKIIDNKKVIDENKIKSDLKKSKIGIVGQLELSGQDNTEIILKSSYLQGKIHNDVKSKEIIDFINKLRAETKR